MPSLRSVLRGVQFDLRFVWVGVALAFFGWVVGDYPFTASTGPGDYTAFVIGPLLAVLGFIVIAICLLSAAQSLKSLLEAGPPVAAPGTGTNTLDRI